MNIRPIMCIAAPLPRRLGDPGLRRDWISYLLIAWVSLSPSKGCSATACVQLANESQKKEGIALHTSGLGNVLLGVDA